jgi:tetratricopeptide (TPR) repeat protein
MRAILEHQRRTVVPRWRPCRSTARLGESEGVDSPSVITAGIDQSVASIEREGAWLQQRSLAAASDYIAGCFLGESRELCSEAAAQILASEQLSRQLRELAQAVLGTKVEGDICDHDANPASRSDIYAYLRAGKIRLLLIPVNAYGWLDMALAYLLLGQFSKCEEAMRMALVLNPEDRLVLRSNVRMLTHFGKSEEAFSLLTRSARCRYDPWLLSALMAMGQVLEKPPMHMRAARELIVSGKFPPHSLSELRSAMASSECLAGSIKNGRRLYRDALANPTENALAQVEWASRDGCASFDSANPPTAPCDFEATCMRGFFQHRWKQSLDDSKKWLVDQPFSGRAATAASYLQAAALEDYASSAEIASRALIITPKQPMLWNNLAFAEASMGKIDEAQAALVKGFAYSKQLIQNAVLTATKGLIAFRAGRHQEGQDLYLDAMEQAVRLGNREIALVASLYLLRESLLAGQASTQSVREQVTSLSDSCDTPGAALALEQVLRRLKDADATEQSKGRDAH